MDNFKNEPLKTKLIKEVSTYGVTQVEFVIETRSDVIAKLTCVLEKKLTDYLQLIKKYLRENSSGTKHYGSSLCEVNAVLRRLKQAERYPGDLTENDDEDEIEHLKINSILQRFVVKHNLFIARYLGYFGNCIQASCKTYRLPKSNNNFRDI